MQERSEKKVEGHAFHSFRVMVPLEKNIHPDIMRSDNEFKRYSRGFNIDLAPKILFSRSTSVDNLIKCGVSSYLEFNNVTQNYFYCGKMEGIEELKKSICEDMVKIPFSKSEIFVN